MYDALGDDPPFALHPHEPNQDCPVGFGIRPVLGEVYADAEAAVRRSLRRRTVADVLDTLLADHPLPAPPGSPVHSAGGTPDIDRPFARDYPNVTGSRVSMPRPQRGWPPRAWTSAVVDVEAVEAEVAVAARAPRR